MSSLSEIRSLIQTIARQDGEGNDVLFAAEVVSVEDESITIKANGVELSDVRTCAIVDGNEQNIRIKPKVGSQVVCLDAGGDRLDVIVVQYSQIESISIHGGKQSTVNGTELKTQLDILSKRVQTLYNALNSCTTDAQGGVSKESVTALLKVQTEKEDFKNIEDNTIKH